MRKRTNELETVDYFEDDHGVVATSNFGMIADLPRPENLNIEAFNYYRRLARVAQFVEQHYPEPLPLETVADVAGLEKSYFSKFFREKTGICYLEWLSWVRVSNAIDVMRTRNVAVTEIAFAVGFQDVRTFQRAFARHTGVTPRAMKRDLRPDPAGSPERYRRRDFVAIRPV